MVQQGIYTGPLNFSRPEDSYHIGPDGTPQLATYFLPEPRYGYDQLGNPQFGTDQIDMATGNIIPQYNRAMAARYDTGGNRLVGNTVSTGIIQGDATYNQNVGQQRFTDTSAGFIGDFGNRISQGSNYVAPPPPPSRFTESMGQGSQAGGSFGGGMGPMGGRVENYSSPGTPFGNPAMGGRSENIVGSGSRNPNLDMGFGGNFQRRPDSRSGQMGDKPSRPRPKVDPRDKDLRRGTMSSSGEGGN